MLDALTSDPIQTAGLAIMVLNLIGVLIVITLQPRDHHRRNHQGHAGDQASKAN
jgi:hypothetical protein